MKMHKRIAILVAFLGIASMPGVARANASCSTLLPEKYNYLMQYGGAWNIEVTVTKDPLQDVTYSTGYLNLSPPWLNGPANLQFSDRYNGYQNFSITATENIRVWIDQTGIVWIRNDNYNYWIVANEDMSCAGNLIYKYVSGLGMVTIAIRSWGTIY